MTAFIALAKGELAEGVENYMAKLGVSVKVAGKPILTQKYGNATYRVINARDVPSFVGNTELPSYDFGITGLDYWLDEALASDGRGSCLPIRALDFAKGDLVLYGKQKSQKKKPVIVMSADTKNVGRKFMNELFGSEWVQLTVNGATEGYVSAGEADLGFDIMSDKNNDENYAGTIKRNELVVLKKLMPTQAILIGRKDYTFQDFLNAVKT